MDIAGVSAPRRLVNECLMTVYDDFQYLSRESFQLQAGEQCYCRAKGAGSLKSRM